MIVASIASFCPNFERSLVRRRLFLRSQIGPSSFTPQQNVFVNFLSFRQIAVSDSSLCFRHIMSASACHFSGHPLVQPSPYSTVVLHSPCWVFLDVHAVAIQNVHYDTITGHARHFDRLFPSLAHTYWVLATYLFTSSVIRYLWLPRLEVNSSIPVHFLHDDSLWGTDEEDSSAFWFSNSSLRKSTFLRIPTFTNVSHIIESYNRIRVADSFFSLFVWLSITMVWLLSLFFFLLRL